MSIRFKKHKIIISTSKREFFQPRLIAYKEEKCGSSGKCRGGFMDEEEAQFEVGEVSESIGLSFEDFDFVIEPSRGPVEMRCLK